MTTIAQIEATETDDAEVEADARAMLADRLARHLEHKREIYLHWREYGLTPRAAFKRAGDGARPWHCPPYYTDATETAREQLVRHRAIAIYRTEIHPSTAAAAA